MTLPRRPCIWELTPCIIYVRKLEELLPTLQLHEIMKDIEPLLQRFGTASWTDETVTYTMLDLHPGVAAGTQGTHNTPSTSTCAKAYAQV